MKKLTIILIVAVVIIGAGIGAWWFLNQNQQNGDDGQQQIQNATYINTNRDEIVVYAPVVGATVTKGLTVTGKAVGGWFHEAILTLEVLDESGEVIASGSANAQGDWMNEDFVDFSGTLQLPAEYTGEATLSLQKSNPSGLLENSASATIPITIE